MASVLFGCLPLRPTVFVHAAVVATFCFVWFLEKFTSCRTVVGAWAFFTKAPQAWGGAPQLETPVYIFSFGSSIVALGVCFVDASRGLQVHFLTTAVRDTIFAMITIVTLASNDWCGPLAAARPCSVATRDSAQRIILVFAVVAAEIHLLWGIRQLWRHYCEQDECPWEDDETGTAAAAGADKLGGYGATPAFMAPPPLSTSAMGARRVVGWGSARGASRSPRPGSPTHII